jgi:Cu2+-exporting ATPase
MASAALADPGAGVGRERVRIGDAEEVPLMEGAARTFEARAIETTAAPVAASIRCAHCGDAVPRGLVDPAAEHSFCCAGCRTVFEVLHAHGLGAYYNVLQASAEGPQPRAQPTGASYAELDDPAFARLHVRNERGGLASTLLYLEGVHCAACVWVVEKLPLVVPGSVEARLDLTRGLTRVTWDPTRTRLSAIARFFDTIGYTPHPFRAAELAELRRKEDRSMLVRIGVAGAIAGNVMLLAFALYSGLFHTMDPGDWAWFRWLSLGLTAITLGFAADVFFRGAFAALRARTLSLDVPVALGLLAGFVGGAVNTVRGAGEVYFDSLATLTFLLLVGRYVQRRGLRRAADASDRLLSLTPSRARRVAGDTVVDVPLEALVVGDEILVRAGDSVPADGVVLDGASDIDRSWWTGEAKPVHVAVGDAIEAGAVNVSSPLRVRVLKTGEETRVGKLLAMVHESLGRRAKVVALADRLSGYFVATVLALAAITLFAWWGAGLDVAAENAVALLIVTCPCALGLATPLAIAAAVGRAARAGVLIKGGDALEKLARGGRVWLDKTGTLTQGKVRLTRFFGDAAVKPLVRALETRASHPIATALAGAFADETPPLRATDYEHVVGGGVSGVVDGRRVIVGSPAFVTARSACVPDWAQAALAGVADAGETPVFVAASRPDAAERVEIVAVLALGDPLRPEARETVDELRALGYSVGILSGDHPDAVRRAAEQLGIDASDAVGGATPERKLAIVRDGVARGTVVMVGDGINDAAALGAASVGVGVHGGAEAGIAAADVFLTRPGIDALVSLIVGARRTLRVVHRNLFFSLLYNVLGSALAMAGVLNPVLAAIMMPASSLTVVTSSYRGRTFCKNERERRPARALPANQIDAEPALFPRLEESSRRA